MDDSEETWLDKMLNKYSDFTRGNYSSTTRRRAIKRVSRWSPQVPVAPDPPKISWWSSKGTAEFLSSHRCNLSQMENATENTYQLEETEVSAPPPPSWPTSETIHPTTPNFSNGNETSFRITEVRGSANPSAPIISQSAFRSTRWDKQLPTFQQCLSSNNINGQQQNFLTSSPSSEVYPKNTTSNNFTSSYDDTRTNLRISILPMNYPLSKLTKKQMDLIQKAILNKIIEQSYEIKVKPQFNGFHCNSGYITLKCGDKATADWTKTIIPTLSPWSDAVLTTVDGEPFKLTKFLRCVFPDAKLDETEHILNLIKAQNDGLSVSDWRLIKRVNLENNSAVLLYAIDQESGEQLEKVNEKIAFRFDTLPVLIQPLNDPIHWENNKIPAKPSLDETKNTLGKHSQAYTGEIFSKRRKS